jgi:hypothetical protein
MGSRLKVYQRRARKLLNPDEQVIAAVHGHQSFLLMFLPEWTHYFFGRMIVVTDQRGIMFGPGFRNIVDEFPLGQGRVRRDGMHMLFTGASGIEERVFIGLGRGRVADKVVDKANS